MTRPRPVQSAIGALLRIAPQLAPRARKLIWRVLYEAASAGGRVGQVTVMNYGFAPVGAAMESWPEVDRFGLALYEKVAGAVDLAGKDVLEVGCGRGGGASFVFERFAVRSMTGLDLARRAIKRGRARYGRPGFELLAGDAERLPFPDGAFDAVLSVETSHCYSDVDRFLAEVHRVLAPDGFLLLADLRDTAAGDGGAGMGAGDIATLRAQLARSGFRCLEEEDLTEGVLLALALNTPAVRARVEERAPRFMRNLALTFAATEGSPMYQRFAEGESIYARFTLQKV